MKVMNDRVNFSLLTSITDMKGDDAKDLRLLKKMANDAQEYLLSFAWCKEIKEGWFGWGVGGVCAVFFFRILPNKMNVDRWLWVVVGDLPSAYLVVDGSPTPLAALDTYVELMQEWVEAAKSGKSTADCIPVSAPVTPQNADLLQRRLDFIRKEFLG